MKFIDILFNFFPPFYLIIFTDILHYVFLIHFVSNDQIIDQDHAGIQKVLSEWVQLWQSFFFLVDKERKTPNTTISGSSSARQRYSIKWRANDGPILNVGLVALWILGDLDQYCWNPMFLCFLRGCPDPLSPPLDPHMKMNRIYLISQCLRERRIYSGITYPSEREFKTNRHGDIESVQRILWKCNNVHPLAHA